MNASDIVIGRRFYGRDLIQERFDYDSDSKVIYSGVAKRGKASSDAAWWVFKYTYNGSNVTLIQCSVQDSIWDNRTTLTYA